MRGVFGGVGGSIRLLTGAAPGPGRQAPRARSPGFPRHPARGRGPRGRRLPARWPRPAAVPPCGRHAGRRQGGRGSAGGCAGVASASGGMARWRHGRGQASREVGRSPVRGRKQRCAPGAARERAVPRRIGRRTSRGGPCERCRKRSHRTGRVRTSRRRPAGRVVRRERRPARPKLGGVRGGRGEPDVRRSARGEGSGMPRGPGPPAPGARGCVAG